MPAASPSKSSPKNKTVFITGATGHLGSEMTRQLVAQGHQVRVLSRRGADLSCLKGLPVEPVPGELDNPESLLRGMKGADWVFHVAANVSFWNGQWTNSYRVNVQGTHNVARAALKAGVKRMVYTSTVATLGKTDGAEVQALDETSTYNLEEKNFVYPHTKYLGELEVHAAVQDGLDAVIVHPSVIIGPGDHKQHFLPLFEQARKGAFLVYPEGRRNVCDVRDVAQGHLLAAEKGKQNEHYILAGENLKNDELVRLFTQAVGGPAPRLQIPKGVFRTLGRINDALANLTGQEPLITTEMAFQGSLHYTISNEKARRELGYTTRPHQQSFADMVAWYRGEGLI